MTTPTAGPWLSPQVVIRNSLPNELGTVQKTYVRSARKQALAGTPSGSHPINDQFLKITLTEKIPGTFETDPRGGFCGRGAFAGRPTRTIALAKADGRFLERQQAVKGHAGFAESKQLHLTPLILSFAARASQNAPPLIKNHHSPH